MKTLVLTVLTYLASLPVVWAQALTDDSLIRQHFTAQEIVGLQQIVAFFDQQVRQSCPSGEDMHRCYRDYLENLIGTPANGVLDLKITQEKETAFLKSLDKALFDNIWKYSEGTTSTDDSTYAVGTYLDYKHHGAYLTFLESVAQHDDTLTLDPYLAAYKASGSVSPSMVGYFVYKYTMFDTRIPRHRLILAVHYLIVNTGPAINQ